MTESSSGVDLAQELRVPVFTTEFQAWNSQREKDLRAVRHAAHEMEIDVAGMEMQQEHDRRAVEDAANAESKLEDMRTIKNKIVSILVREFSGLKLPSGLTITEDSVEDYMAELESVTTKAPGRHAELLRKVKEVAPLLENYMPHLRDRWTTWKYTKLFISCFPAVSSATEFAVWIYHWSAPFFGEFFVDEKALLYVDDIF